MISGFKDSVPAELVKHVTAMFGVSGEAWFEDLPGTIRALEEKWDVEIQLPFTGIEYNYVAPAVMAGSALAVVKISPPYEDNEIFRQARYLRELNGNGAVRLLAEDRALLAILIEYASPGVSLTECFEGRELDAVVPAINVLRAILRPPPDDLTDVIMLDDWFEGLRRHSEKPAFPSAYAERALRIYENLSSQPGRTYYLHGDLHPSNIVSSVRNEYLAIDPKGMVGHIGYEIAVFLNNFHWWQETSADVRERLKIALSLYEQAFGISEIELRHWAFAQMVLSAWWTFDEMPDIYDGDVAKADIWDV